MSSYGKNQKKLRKRLEEMGQKEHFLPKTTKFWPKSRKREFFPGIFFRHLLKDQQISYYGKNQKKQDKGMIGSPDFQNMKEIEILS